MNNTLKKPVLLQSSAANNNSGQFLTPTSNSNQGMAIPSISVSNTQNVYFIQGNPTIPIKSSSAQSSPSKNELRWASIEQRIALLEKAQAESSFFSANVFRPSSAGWFETKNREPFGLSSRSLERPFVFGKSNESTNGTSFAKSKSIFEQRPFTASNEIKGRTFGPKTSKGGLFNLKRNENTLDVIDGIAKPEDTFILEDYSDDEN